MPGLGDEEWRAHAELIGRVTIAWNHCVHQLLRVFRHLTGMPPDISAEVFLGQRSDQGQRMMLKRLATLVDLGEGPRADLGKLLKRLDEVGSNRNLATHTIFGLSLVDPETSGWSTLTSELIAAAWSGSRPSSVRLRATEILVRLILEAATATLPMADDDRSPFCATRYFISGSWAVII